MAVVAITTGLSLAQHLAVKQRVHEMYGPVPGQLLQVCCGEGDGLLIVTVYESEADYDTFTQTVLAKVLADLDHADIPYDSQVLPAHDVTVERLLHPV